MPPERGGLIAEEGAQTNVDYVIIGDKGKLCDTLSSRQSLVVDAKNRVRIGHLRS